MDSTISDIGELIDYFPNPAYLWKREGSKLIFSRANMVAMEITGGKAEQLNGRTAAEAYEEQQEIYDDLWLCLKKKKSFMRRIDYSYVTTGWTRNLIALYCYVPKNYVLIITVDETQKLIQTQQLKDTKRKYQFIIEHMNDLVAIINSDLIVEYMNEHAHLNELGYSKADFIGTALSPGFIYPEDFWKVKYILDNICSQEEITKEIRLRDIDGTYLWFEVKGKLIRNLSTETEKKLMVISRNISQKKQFIQELEESESKWRFFLKNAPDVIFTLDRSGKIKYINSPPSGLTSDQVINTSVYEYVDPDYRDTVKEAINYVFETGDSTTYEIRARGPEDSVSWYSTRVGPLTKGEEIELVILITRDITEKKEYETKLKELNAFKSQLMRRCSHELKTPLISIMGYTELFYNDHQEELTPQMRFKIEEIEKGCARLDEIIKKILDSLKYSSGLSEIKPQKEDLTFLINFIIDELYPLYTTRNLSIKKELPDEVWVKIEKEKIFQVVENLLINAIKYTPPPGTISIKAYDYDDKTVCVEINDTGIGFTEMERTKIFKKFGKIERFGKGFDVGIDGSGLGLYISKKIIELHEGNIWMESAGRNQGSTFYFTLPKADN
ncbi:MAG: putative Histidine kinase [Promethearchaeota archaeon]|nr:MAG: putative Histidine kinase [Candidatus Lokiarchaeota archaeon]